VFPKISIFPSVDSRHFCSGSMGPNAENVGTMGARASGGDPLNRSKSTRGPGQSCGGQGWLPRERCLSCSRLEQPSHERFLTLRFHANVRGRYAIISQ
jgi:hypothetical protein